MPTLDVLAVGLDPEFADLDEATGLSPDRIRAYVMQQIDRVRDAGFDVVDCLISPDDAGERRLTASLASRGFDCVLIGAGLRKPPALLWLFENVMNAIHEQAPQAKICFNSAPGDTLEAIIRRLGP